MFSEREAESLEGIICARRHCRSFWARDPIALMPVGDVPGPLDDADVESGRRMHVFGLDELMLLELTSRHHSACNRSGDQGYEGTNNNQAKGPVPT